MTIARVQSYAFSGIEAVPVEVQVQISSGVPAFLVVGLPDKAVGEARERVRAALPPWGFRYRRAASSLIWRPRTW
jgi:magnesium chelatase family protein